MKACGWRIDNSFDREVIHDGAVCVAVIMRAGHQAGRGVRRAARPRWACAREPATVVCGPPQHPNAGAFFRLLYAVSLASTTMEAMAVHPMSQTLPCKNASMWGRGSVNALHSSVAHFTLPEML